MTTPNLGLETIPVFSMQAAWACDRNFAKLDESIPAGGIDRAAAVPNSEAATIAALVNDFNALLASLRAAGLLAV